MNLTRKTFFVTVLGCFLLTAMLSGCGKTSGTEANNKSSAVTSEGGNTTEQATETKTQEDDDSFAGYYLKKLDVTPVVDSWHKYYFLYTSEDGLYGVMNYDGEVLTEPKYTYVFDATCKEYDTGTYTEIYGVVKGECVEKINPVDKSVTVLDYDDVRGVTGSQFGNNGYLFVNEKKGRWDLYQAVSHANFTDSNGIEYDGLTLVVSSEKAHDDLIAFGYSEEMASRYPERYEEDDNNLCFKGETLKGLGDIDATYWTNYNPSKEKPIIYVNMLPSSLYVGARCAGNRRFTPSPDWFVVSIDSAYVKKNYWNFVSNQAFEQPDDSKGTVKATVLRYDDNRWLRDSGGGGMVFIGTVRGRECDTVFRPIAYLGKDNYLGWEYASENNDGYYGILDADDYVVATLTTGYSNPDDIYTKLEGTANSDLAYLQKRIDKKGNLSWSWNDFFVIENDAGDRFTLYKLPEYGETEIKKVNATPYTSVDMSTSWARVGYEDGTFGYLDLREKAESTEISGRYKSASIPANGSMVLVSEDGESFFFMTIHNGKKYDDQKIDAVEAYQLTDNTYCIKKADGSYWIMYR